MHGLEMNGINGHVPNFGCQKRVLLDILVLLMCRC